MAEQGWAGAKVWRDRADDIGLIVVESSKNMLLQTQVLKVQKQLG